MVADEYVLDSAQDADDREPTVAMDCEEGLEVVLWA